MGYAVQNFLNLAAAIRSCNLSGVRVFDLGSQDVKIFDEVDYENLVGFIAQFNGDKSRIPELVEGKFPAVISARDVFSAAGFEYSCCDFDQRSETIYLDFNTLAFDRTLYGTFDLVMNAGTTEHISNYIAVFFLMHQICKADGILFNEVPLSGWTNHGFNNLTAKFWHTLCWMNSYRTLLAQVKYISDHSRSGGDFGGEHIRFIKNLEEAVTVSSTIEIIFQKATKRGFIPPYDAILPNNNSGASIAKLVMGSLRPFIASGALTADEALATTVQFLEYQGFPVDFP